MRFCGDLRVDEPKKANDIEELLREMRLLDEQRPGNRPFEPPPGYAWGHANLPEIWKGNRGGMRVIRGETRRVSEKNGGGK